MKNGTILIVDDNKNVLSALRIFLSNYFKNVYCISSPNALLTSMREYSPDIVLLDMNYSAGINTGNIKNNIMPVLFIGHGTPMNAIEDNEFSSKWKELGKILPKPKAILCISPLRNRRIDGNGYRQAKDYPRLWQFP